MWEFKYVSLRMDGPPLDPLASLGLTKDSTYKKPVELLADRMNQISDLGKVGWEPVGEVEFTLSSENSSQLTTYAYLMFKRPIAEQKPDSTPEVPRFEWE